MVRPKARQRGIAAVEFGLIMPIVLVLLFAIFEFGTAFWRKQVLTTAVRQGARAGIVATNPRKTESQIKQIVYDYLDGVGYTASGRTVQAVPEVAWPLDAGESLTVTVEYPTSFLILSRLPLGGVSSYVDGSGNIKLEASITMQAE